MAINISKNNEKEFELSLKEFFDSLDNKYLSSQNIQRQLNH